MKQLVTAIFFLVPFLSFGQIQVDTTSADSSTVILEIVYQYDSLTNQAYRDQVYTFPDGSKTVRSTPKKSLQEFRDQELEEFNRLNEQIEFLEQEFERMKQEYRNLLITKKEAIERWQTFKASLGF